jgi:catechol 2,3-dioxygenase-like lactoylglutathione lyase family enzyme
MPVIECEQLHPGLTVADLPASIEFYTRKLGFHLGFTWGDPATFAGLNLDKVQIFLAKGTPKPSSDSSVAYFVVDNADDLYEFHSSSGVEIAQAIDDRPYGMRDYTVRDLNGYYLGFGRHALNAGPPVRIERVEIPVRLEKRLAGLLEDLASHKKMTVGSCLEEMILHTNEGVGPHTKATLRYIGELKKKHGIDYDCHASYRFAEG